jgi:hypothetical protein
MSITNQVWLLITVLAVGVVVAELSRPGRSGWAALPAFFLLFGVGAAWIRGYHKAKKREESGEDP